MIILVFQSGLPCLLRRCLLRRCLLRCCLLWRCLFWWPSPCCSALCLPAAIRLCCGTSLPALRLGGDNHKNHCGGCESFVAADNHPLAWRQAGKVLVRFCRRHFPLSLLVFAAGCCVFSSAVLWFIVISWSLSWLVTRFLTCVSSFLESRV